MACKAVGISALCAALAVLLVFANPTWRCLASPADPASEAHSRPGAWWMKLHNEFAEEIDKADSGEGYELLLYGDAIMEAFRGTFRGEECERCEGVPEVFDQYFGDKYRSEVLAIGGDETGHLLWRIQNGELPREHHPKVVVLMIGNNDISNVPEEEGEAGIFKAVDGAIWRIILTTRYLRDHLPDTHVVLMGLLPRGGHNKHYTHRQPSIYTKPLELLSWRVKAITNVDGHLHFLDCSDHFVGGPHGDIDPALMPDALHPSKAGYEVLAECMDPLILSLMRHPPSVLGRKGAAGGGDDATSVE